MSGLKHDGPPSKRAKSSSIGTAPFTSDSRANSSVKDDKASEHSEWSMCWKTLPSELVLIILTYLAAKDRQSAHYAAAISRCYSEKALQVYYEGRLVPYYQLFYLDEIYFRVLKIGKVPLSSLTVSMLPVEDREHNWSIGKVLSLDTVVTNLTIIDYSPYSDGNHKRIRLSKLQNVSTMVWMGIWTVGAALDWTSISPKLEVVYTCQTLVIFDPKNLFSGKQHVYCKFPDLEQLFLVLPKRQVFPEAIKMTIWMIFTYMEIPEACAVNLVTQSSDMVPWLSDAVLKLLPPTTGERISVIVADTYGNVDQATLDTAWDHRC